MARAVGRRHVQGELCDMMRAPRQEAELWWYAEAGKACNRTADLPRVPIQVARRGALPGRRGLPCLCVCVGCCVVLCCVCASRCSASCGRTAEDRLCCCYQEPALWALAGPAVVTRFGAVLAHGKRVVLDPERHGVCHRMRVPEDLSPRQTAAAGDPNELSGPGRVRELFVLSQPWGHTVFHFLVECLPKVSRSCSQRVLRAKLLLRTPSSLLLLPRASFRHAPRQRAQRTHCVRAQRWAGAFCQRFKAFCQ